MIIISIISISPPIAKRCVGELPITLQYRYLRIDPSRIDPDPTVSSIESVTFEDVDIIA